MERIKALKGIYELTKAEQKNILGGGCTQQDGLCCRRFSGAFLFCEPGLCRPTGFCFYY
ncbi:hypothetical protein ACJD0Z_05910 [Flavobacteriaceae bacterium M23B6Z8]